MPILILLISLCFSLPAWADDLGMAGALSGFGQGMGRGFESMQSGIIQQGLMDRRAEHERQLREQQYQREREWQQQRDQAAAARHIQESANQEAAQLTAEAHALNQEGEGLDARAKTLNYLSANDPMRYREEVESHNQQVESHKLHQTNYMGRRASFYARYGLTPPQESQAPERVMTASNKEQGAEEKLNGLRPGWRQIIGSAGSDAPYRQWLKRQPKAYQKVINNSATAEEINESIEEYLAAAQR